MIDRKGTFLFPAITFLITNTIEGILILSGFRITDIPAMYGQLVIAGVMWAPTLAAVLPIKFFAHDGFAITNFRSDRGNPTWLPGSSSPLVSSLSTRILGYWVWEDLIGRLAN
jgi:hypothetical protein